MRFTVLFSFLCLTLILGCNKKISTSASTSTSETTNNGVTQIVAFNEVASLAPGETARVEKTQAAVTFLDVASDSRCPRNVNCITEGEAFVMVSVGGEAPQKVRIDVGPKRISRLGMEGATVEFLSLNPYPEAGVKIDPADRRLGVRIIKSSKM
ncbi:MAG: hypothetical protein ACJATN_000854 [Neolewinella sp.]|jgi:hypothetical protein